MSANATLTNINATESVQSTTNPLPTGDLVTSSISETFTSDVIARQNVDQADTCLIEYPLWRSGDNCMDKQLTENILFGLSIGKSFNPQYPASTQISNSKCPNPGSTDRSWAELVQDFYNFSGPEPVLVHGFLSQMLRL